MQSKTVLFIAMEFPPVNSTGMYRSLKLVKYLPNLHVNPVVITVDIEDGCDAFNTKRNDELMNEIPSSVPIFRFPLKKSATSKKPGLLSYLRHFFRLNEGMYSRFYNEDLKYKVSRIVNQYKPDVVYVSLPPFSTGKIARKLISNIDLPLIVDMRDAWAKWSSGPFVTRVHYYLTLLQEKKLFRKASIITAVTPELSDIFIKTHPEIARERFEVIPNGFDLNNKDEIFEGDTIIALPPLQKDRKYIIGYIGSFYYDPIQEASRKLNWWKRPGTKKFHYFAGNESWLYRSPYFFLKALNSLFEEDQELKGLVRFDFIGKKPMWLDKMLEKFDMNENFFWHGFLSQKEVFERQKTFDAFLATSEKVINGRHFCLPSKIFDYIKLDKPIIAFLTEGAQTNFFDSVGGAIICDPDDLPASVLALRRLIYGNLTLVRNNRALVPFHRYEQAKKFSEIIHRLLPH